tara:strand:+ start:54 stop:455 length:402 start_codon:yes stop_codon:yes gene_type:complete
MEDKLIKLTNLTILLIGFILLVSSIGAEDKSINKENFMRINPNITNEALRAELEDLVLDFDAERQRVHDSYAKQIKALKEERRLEIKSVKDEFNEKRNALFAKYGEDRKKNKPAISPDKKKKVKDKKSLRKPK